MIKKISDTRQCIRYFFGAAGRGRTDTVSLPPDFESGASANSTTAAYSLIIISHFFLKVKKNIITAEYFSVFNIRYCYFASSLLNLSVFALSGTSKLFKSIPSAAYLCSPIL